MTRQRFAFVLRLWLETTTGNPKAKITWRGSLEVIEPKQLYYFTSFNHIPKILQEITGRATTSGSNEAEKEDKMET